MINIEEGCLCAFDEDGFFLLQCLMEKGNCISNAGREKLCCLFPFFRNLFPEKTLHALPMSRSFIRVCGSNAALRCADASSLPRFLQCGIPLFMLFRHNVCRTGNFEPREDIDSCFLQSLYFLQQRRQVNHHPAPEDDYFSFMQRPCGEQVEDMFLSSDDNRVSGVCSAACACEDIEMGCEEINELAFPFIPPLRADDDGDIPEAFQELLHMCRVPELLLCVESLEV